jgi:hypothetical protein
MQGLAQKAASEYLACWEIKNRSLYAGLHPLFARGAENKCNVFTDGIHLAMTPWRQNVRDAGELAVARACVSGHHEAR